MTRAPYRDSERTGLALGSYRPRKDTTQPSLHQAWIAGWLRSQSSCVTLDKPPPLSDPLPRSSTLHGCWGPRCPGPSLVTVGL